MTTTPATVEAMQIGDGVSYGYGADSTPYTVIGFSETRKTITIQQDEVMILNNHGGGECDYVTFPNPDGAIHVFTLRSNGRYYAKGVEMGRQGALGLGGRRYYRDPSF